MKYNANITVFKKNDLKPSIFKEKDKEPKEILASLEKVFNSAAKIDNIQIILRKGKNEA